MNTRQKKTTRTLLFKNQKGKCCYCEETFSPDEMTLEHLHRKCEGGPDKRYNLALACTPCNNGRGSIDWLTYKSYKMGELLSA